MLSEPLYLYGLMHSSSRSTGMKKVSGEAIVKPRLSSRRREAPCILARLEGGRSCSLRLPVQLTINEHK
jgi:hypothetical protein